MNPKLRQMERQGDLLSGQVEDFCLVSETGIDGDRIKRQWAESQQKSMDAARIAAVNQGSFAKEL